jgi:hypothetical protein
MSVVLRPNPGLVRSHTAAAAANWWEVTGQTCVAAYAPRGAASQAASYVNLANPGTYDCTVGAAPTWDATNGWIFNGSSQYLITGIVPNSDDWSAFVRFSNATGQFGWLLCGGSSYSIMGVSADWLYARCYFNGQNFQLGPATVTSGVLAVAGRNGYYNGASEVTLGISNNAWRNLYIGARNNDGTAIEYGASRIQAVAIYSTALSAGDVAALTTAMNAL